MWILRNGGDVTQRIHSLADLNDSVSDSISPNPRTPRVAPARVLVIEDEPSIADVVSTALRHDGHEVQWAATGDGGLQRAMDDVFDLIVLDVMLPGIDGLEVCRRLRDRGRTFPVLFLTARSDTDQRLAGFLAGGDDYLTKPFEVDELRLRVAAILRRVDRVAVSAVLAIDDLTLDVRSRDVTRDGDRIDLSVTEFGLLHYLMVNAGIVVSKAQILVNVWPEDYDGGENIVELYIGYLRRKIDDGRVPLIQTRRGMGYLLRLEERA